MGIAQGRVDTFPSVSLRSRSGGLPVEVTLVGQLGIGEGDRLIASTAALQARHPHHADALDEPSARIGSMDLSRGDPTALYSFVVGPQGHPFHCHAGHRVFTAVAGSGGARLCFSTESRERIDADPRGFARTLECVDVPPDAMFTVRFGGGTWHRFVPLAAGHPALMALSCHSNELGGGLSSELERLVRAGQGDIPSLTELLPDTVAEAVAEAFAAGQVPATVLALSAPADSLAGRACRRSRSMAGILGARMRRTRKPRGFAARNAGHCRVDEHPSPPPGSLLADVLDGANVHQDWFALELPSGTMPEADVERIMACMLEGFVCNQAASVTGLMAFRNVLVRPLGLRTSRLGCPASSLLSEGPCRQRFDGRFPVLDVRREESGRWVEVLLGADDRHLSFRSCVRVERMTDGTTRFGLGTRVRPTNLFGRLYIAMITRTHRRHVAPTMLRSAVAHVARAVADVPGIGAPRVLLPLPVA
ncbi:DUF2867 domain-containing protein [Marilutibacter chinensis]|uniref:DUF2867 domain-containing protein n=1 Tax=Marilutibacter chinensis TaxID=2912247 RepID=A0ABS9HXX3_9GAMM|nr:DUF2867 domain-containing protein [Lysobacter chinensis]MCF7221234.1 DUF2867 domain-containing protein [Lysobacter chinensis]MCF7223025.1 DUF2867 domain-containing protein [Lysobacter chinensis]